MGTALTGAENAEWGALLRDVPAARRTALVALLSAAPLTAGQHAYTVTDITGLGSLDAVRRTIEAVPGFRIGDVEYFMQVYSAIRMRGLCCKPRTLTAAHWTDWSGRLLPSGRAYD